MFVTEELDWRLTIAWLLAPMPGIAGWLFLTEWFGASWGVRASLIMYSIVMLGLVTLLLALVLAAIALYGHCAEDYGDLMLIATDKGFLLMCWSGIPIAYLAVSGDLCRYLDLTFGGFVVDSANSWQWMLMSVTLVAERVVALTAPGLHPLVFGIHVTAAWSTALVVALNLLLIVGIVDLALLWRASSWDSRGGIETQAEADT